MIPNVMTSLVDVQHSVSLGSKEIGANRTASLVHGVLIVLTGVPIVKMTYVME